VPVLCKSASTRNDHMDSVRRFSSSSEFSQHSSDSRTAAVAPVNVAKVAPAGVPTPKGWDRPPLAASENRRNSDHVFAVSGEIRAEKDSQTKILVVDDASLNRKIMLKLLATRYSNLNECEDGRDTLEAVVTSMGTGEPYVSLRFDGLSDSRDGRTHCCCGYACSRVSGVCLHALARSICIFYRILFLPQYSGCDNWSDGECTA
jgi:hypothetical protein